MVEEAPSRWETTLRQAIGSHINIAYCERLLQMASSGEYLCGEYLFREGESRRELYVVLEGKVDLRMTVPGRGSQRLLTVGPGELLAWSAIVGSGNMTCDGVATTDVVLACFNAHKLESAFTEVPELGFQFMQWLATGVAARLTATRLQMLDLFTHEVRR
ncbi:MAG: cyclic nucleotide-binding domain-containing protein [Planctomycetaceae bacterium]|nr:cyclic nucleotide-binding domain-containing protein [Planctomycetaceae bacterium]